MRLIAMIRDLAAVAVLVLLGACSGAPGDQQIEPGAAPAPTDAESARAQPSGTPEPVAKPPNGSRWLGVDDLVFAVPVDWRVETEPCAEPDGDVVRFLGPGSARGDCASDPASGVDSLVIAPEGLGALSRIGQLDRAFNVDGIVVRHRAAACRAGANKSCRLDFGADDLDTVFRLTYSGPDPRGFVAALLDSARRLPEGSTTVPFIQLGTSVEDARRTLERLGLVGDLPDVEFPHYVVGTRPVAGSVVPTGSTVEVAIGDG